MTFDAAEKLPTLSGAARVAAKLGVEVREVDAPAGVLADRDDVGARLAPRQLVRVMLVGTDEHDRALYARRVEVEQADELVDRARRARSTEHDDVVGRPVHGAVDDAAGVLTQRGRLPAGRGRLRVRVRVQRQHAVADVVLDERQRAPRGGEVGVDHPARAERPVEHRVVADHRAADALDQLRGVAPLTWPEHRGTAAATGGSAGGIERARHARSVTPARLSRALVGAAPPWTRQAPARLGLRRVRWALTDAMAGAERFATWRHRRVLLVRGPPLGLG